MSFPSLNTPLLSFRYMRDLALPCTSLSNVLIALQVGGRLIRIIVAIYPAVLRLATLLHYTFDYRLSPAKHVKAEYPEVRLMSLLIVAVKLSQALDDEERSPRTAGEAAALTIDWNTWERAMSNGELPNIAKGLLHKGKEADVTEPDVSHMDGQQLDQYMDWFEKTWIADAESRREHVYLAIIHVANQRQCPHHFCLSFLQRKERRGEQVKHRLRRRSIGRRSFGWCLGV